jgi:hypothetical protein
MKVSLAEMRPFIAILLAILIVCLFGWTLAQAQHNHAAGHDEYKNWVSRDNAACCNRSDCGTVKPEDERIEGGQHQIKIEGTWCPIKPGMYLRTGKSPDWSSSHACVWPNWSGDKDVCSRLKCYMAAGGT